MTHPIYYSSITENALLLEQLVCASKNYVAQLEINFENKHPDVYSVSEFDIQIESYKEWLTDSVSNYLIQISTKIRIIQDSDPIEIDDNESDYSADKEAFDKFHDIITLQVGSFKPSIRECCNKIIHALEYELEFIKNDTGAEYWSGICLLKGRLHSKEWCVKLNTLKFAMSLRYYIETIKYL